MDFGPSTFDLQTFELTQIIRHKFVVRLHILFFCNGEHFAPATDHAQRFRQIILQQFMQFRQVAGWNQWIDVVVDVVDASNLERNLFLTTELLEIGCPVVVVLNMADMARDRGLKIDIPALSARLGVPVVPEVQHTVMVRLASSSAAERYVWKWSCAV